MSVIRHPNTAGATLTQWRYTATGGETSLSGTDGFSTALSYTVGSEQVFINGVLLERGVDYVATTGTTITGLTALVVNDIATVISPSSFNVANAIPLSTVTAKGDLIAGTGASTVSNLAVGADGTTLVANSSSSTGVAWAGPSVAAGKNAIINGDFSINQRNFTSTTTAAAYGFDRWNLQTDASAVTYSTQAFTAGAAPVSGYESKNFARLVTTSQTGVAYGMLQQKIEDVRTFANQTVTVSFWAKATSGTPKIGVAIDQNFGSGGSTAVTTASITIPTITTSWVRYSFNVSLPTISGKTIGTSSYLGVNIVCSMTTSYNPPYPAVGLQNNTFDIWGVQVEAGSVATAFQTATGTLQGELAACQRYYFRNTFATTGDYGWIGAATAGNTVNIPCPLPVTMRTTPSSVDYSNLRVFDFVNAAIGVSAVTLLNTTGNPPAVSLTASGITTYRPYAILANTLPSYIGFSAEL